MNTEKLYKILEDTTKVYRKGNTLETKKVGNINVTELFGYKHTSESIVAENFEKVDMIFVDVVVDKAKANQYKTDLGKILQEYPQPERLAGGPSYIELATNLGLEQEGALRTMALGKALGMWNIMSGKILGMNDEQAREFAGNGFLMISGYKIGGRK